MKPATALPQGVPPDSHIYIGNLCTTPRTIAMWREKANAYPELVEELRAAHRECDRAGLAVQATMGDCAVAANLAFQRDAIAALLAKLGEQ